MSGPEPIFAHTWEEKAREQLRTAEILATARQWSDAFYHAGFAVECALKCRIMRAQRLNQWPEKGSFHIHDLTKLAGYAQVTGLLLAEIGALSPIGIAWQVAKDWSISVRYDPRPFPVRRGADMVKAVGEQGLLEWLLKP